jgi:hypothetical protein
VLVQPTQVVGVAFTPYNPVDDVPGPTNNPIPGPLHQDQDHLRPTGRQISLDAYEIKVAKCAPTVTKAQLIKELEKTDYSGSLLLTAP